MSPRDTFMGSLTDVPQHIWFLRWTPWALAHVHNPLLTDRLDAPAGVNLMWNPLMPLLGFLLWPVTALAGPITSYDVLATLAPALSGAAAYAAARRLTGSRGGSLAAGFLYGFSPYVMSQAHGHVNLSMVPIPPLMLLLLHDIVVTRRRSARHAGILLGLFAFAQLMLFEELLASEAVMSAVALAILGLQHRDLVAARVRHLLRSLGVAVAVFVPLAAGPLAVQFAGPNRVSGQLYPSGPFSTDVLNIVVPTDTQIVAPPWALDITNRFGGDLPEWDAYLGIPLLLLLLAIVAWRRRDPLVRWAAWTGIAALVLSMGPALRVGGTDTHVPLPWAVIDHVPVINNMLPARLAVYADLMVALLVAVALRDLAGLPRRQRRAVILTAALAAITLVPKSFEPAKTTVPAFFTGADVERIPEGSVALVLPIASVHIPDAMLWQAESDMRFRMPGGYVLGSNILGRDGSELLDRVISLEIGAGVPPLDAGVRRRLFAEMRAHGIESVIVGPDRRRAAMVADLTSLLGRPPLEVGGVDLWQNVGALTG